MRRGIAAGAVAAAVVPLVAMSADQLRMAAEKSGQEVGIVDGGSQDYSSMLQAVEDNLGLFRSASWLALVAAVLTAVATVALWRSAVDRSPRWAWAGAGLGTCSVAGQFVHLMGYFALVQVLAVHGDREAANRIFVEGDDNAFALALFVPYLLGVLLAPAVQAVALRRAGLIPRWALAAVLVGSAVMMVLGSTPIASAVWAAALTAGFLPFAARAITRAAARTDGPSSTAPTSGSSMPATAPTLTH